MVSTTSRPTRAGSMSVSITIPRPSRSKASGAGGAPWERSAISGATSLLITADCGGSNGVRVRLWKRELQTFANETGLSITVAHHPPGTSKWNRIEHRLFAFITQNWRGKPLISREVIIQLIAATTTEAGLNVQCCLDENDYPKAIKVSDAEMAAINIACDDFHGEWNYTISPISAKHSSMQPSPSLSKY